MYLWTCGCRRTRKGRRRRRRFAGWRFGAFDGDAWRLFDIPERALIEKEPRAGASASGACGSDQAPYLQIDRFSAK